MSDCANCGRKITGALVTYHGHLRRCNQCRQKMLAAKRQRRAARIGTPKRRVKHARRPARHTLRRAPTRDPNLMTRQELARQLGVTVSTVDSWRRVGLYGVKLQAVGYVRYGRAWGFRWADVEAWRKMVDARRGK